MNNMTAFLGGGAVFTLVIAAIEAGLARPTRHQVAQARETLLEEDLPEAESTEGSLAHAIYVVAKTKREAEKWAQDRLQGYPWVYVSDETDLMPLRGQQIFFVENWSDRRDAVALWTAAHAGGNTVHESSAS